MMTHPWQDIREKGFHDSTTVSGIGQFRVASGENVSIQLLEINNVVNNLTDQTSF